MDCRIDGPEQAELTLVLAHGAMFATRFLVPPAAPTSFAASFVTCVAVARSALSGPLTRTQLEGVVDFDFDFDFDLGLASLGLTLFRLSSFGNFVRTGFRHRRRFRFRGIGLALDNNCFRHDCFRLSSLWRNCFGFGGNFRHGGGPILRHIFLRRGFRLGPYRQLRPLVFATGGASFWPCCSP